MPQETIQIRRETLQNIYDLASALRGIANDPDTRALALNAPIPGRGGPKTTNPAGEEIWIGQKCTGDIKQPTVAEALTTLAGLLSDLLAKKRTTAG